MPGSRPAIGSLVLLRRLFAIDVRAERRLFEDAAGARQEPLERRSVAVRNASLDGLALRDVTLLERLGVVVSRLRRAGRTEVEAVSPDGRLHVGDVVLAVATRSALDEFERVVGTRTPEDLATAPGVVTTRRWS